MNAWIEEMARLTGLGRQTIDFSLSDLSSLIPDARALWVIGALVAFMAAAYCEEHWPRRHDDGRSSDHEN